MTEFALIAPLFFLLIFGVIQMGILFGGQIALTNAAREVARYASTVPAGQSQGAIDAQALPILQRSIPAYDASASSVAVLYCWYPNPTTPVTYSQKVIITITYGHTLFVPLVGGLIDGLDGTPGNPDNKYTTTAREEMKVETVPLKNPPAGQDCLSLIGANP